MLKRLRQGPALQGRRLIQGAGLLFEQRQIMTRLENEVVAGVAARMTGDLDAVAENDDLVDEALHQHVAKPVARRDRIVVRAIANERQGRDLRRAFVAGLERRRGKLPQGRSVGDKPLADRLFMPAGAFVLAGETTLRELGVQRVNRRGMRHGRQKIGARILHQPLDLALVVALAWTTEAIVEQKMADQLGESLRATALAVAENLRHGDLEIVVEYRQRNAAEKSEGRDVAVEKSLRRLRGIGFDEAGVRMRQVEAEHMQLHPHAADHRHAFAEIDLRVTRRMRERHEDLARPRARQPHIVLHHRVAAGKAVLVPKPFENPLRRCRCLGGAVLSASRIASITGNNGPSFGRSGALCARNPAEPSSGTSSPPCPGSAQKRAPLHAGCFPQ